MVCLLVSTCWCRDLLQGAVTDVSMDPVPEGAGSSAGVETIDNATQVFAHILLGSRKLYRLEV